MHYLVAKSVCLALSLERLVREGEVECYIWQALYHMKEELHLLFLVPEDRNKSDG